MIKLDISCKKMNASVKEEDSNGFCLICKGTKDLRIIYKIYAAVDNMTYSYSELIMKCFYIQFLDKQNGKDNMLCLPCIGKIKFCIKFRKQVEMAHKLLYNIKLEKQCRNVVKREKHLKYNRHNKSKLVKNEFKEEEKDCFEDSDNEPIMNLKNRYSNHNDDHYDSVNFGNESDSDWSVKTDEISRATGYKDQTKKSKEKIKFSIPTLDTTELQCPECNKIFPHHYLLKKHHLEHFPQYICHVCGLTFTKRFFYMKHVKSHSTEKFSCDMCDKKYNTLEAMSKHRQINHFNFLPFVCFRCSKRFKSNLMKKKHLLDIHGIKSKMHKCLECEQEFFSLHTMETHLKKQHFKLKEHKCCACSTAFYSKRDLNKHYLVKHEGVKSHKCEVCNKLFSYSKGLRTHRKIHLNQRDHVCQLCGKAFIQQTSLKYHMRTHHKEVG